jgi:hypothetical protein
MIPWILKVKFHIGWVDYEGVYFPSSTLWSSDYNLYSSFYSIAYMWLAFFLCHEKWY